MASAYQTSSHYSMNQSHPAASTVQERPNLPSLKDLNFTYSSPQSQEGPPPQNGPNQSEHAPPPSAHSGRHDSASWGRVPPPGSQMQSHHAQAMPPRPKPSKSSKQQPVYRTEGYARPEQPTHKPNGSWGPPPATYPPQPPAPVAGSQNSPPSQGPLKHGRTESTVSASPGRSPHQAPYPPYASQPHAPSTLYQVASTTAPPPEAIQQPPPFAQANAGTYQYSAPPHMQRGAYAAQPPPPPPSHQHPPQHQQQQQQHQQVPQGNPYQQQQEHPPPQHWQSSPAGTVPPPPAQSQSQMQNFVRTTPIVPANIDPRAAPPPAPSTQPQTPIPPPDDRIARQSIINEIVKHCSTLWGFANKYAQPQPQLQPHPNELRDMSHFANEVVKLLEDLKRISFAEDQPPREGLPPAPVAEETRPPKRPWEDMSREDHGTPNESDGHYGEEASQSTAEQDMEIIRSKRATSSTGAAPGQPKSKYRKRSRATPPGKCHSCNIRETPEWRRGPDGARTLCNACGLHYAKLVRKRDKQLGADGKPIPIDLQTLRMSTMASKEHSKGHHHDNSARQTASAGPAAEEQSPATPSPSGSYEPQKQPMQQPPHIPPHGSPYQMPSVPNQGAPPSASSPHQMMHPPPLQPQNQPPSGLPSPSQSSWMASPPSSRAFPPPEPPSYMRPQHNSASHTRSTNQ